MHEGGGRGANAPAEASLPAWGAAPRFAARIGYRLLNVGQARQRYASVAGRMWRTSMRHGARQFGARLLRREYSTSTGPQPASPSNAHEHCCDKECLKRLARENPDWRKDHRAQFSALDTRQIGDHFGSGSGRRHSQNLWDAAHSFLCYHIQDRGFCRRSALKVISANLAYKRTHRNVNGKMKQVALMDDFRTRGVDEPQHIVAPETVPRFHCCQKECLTKALPTAVTAERSRYVARLAL